ncbi:MAG: glucosamine-6-phosphate deaminase [Sphaerochaetaceae bacterium]|nr:glucosamine-6-phosphate deaminase [Sphaerochaetaceae bacterium]
MQYKVDKLDVNIYPSNREMGQAAAKAIGDDLCDLLSKKSEVNVMFAAAPSQNTTLEALLDDKRIDWSRINAFHMDEYVGISIDRPQSFRNYLKVHIFDRKPFKSVNLINADGPDAEKIASDYARLLKERGLDLIVLGIGETGHIAFNDPPEARFNEPKLAKVIELGEVSRMQQVHDGCFATLDDVPKQAITVTIPAFVAASRLHCVVPGPTKCKAVKATLEGPVSEDCPATVLRLHDNAHLYIDKDSASLLKRTIS